jgi:hypothetical protein
MRAEDEQASGDQAHTRLASSEKEAVYLMSNEFPASESPTPRPEVPSGPDLAKPAPRNPTGRT